MFSKIFSCSSSGLSCSTVEVQADISNGLPSFSIVGLGDVSVQESKERVRASIKNTGFKFPPTKKVINLAPAQIRKEGPAFDLPIAISLLLASRQISVKNLEKSIIIGELSLTGNVKPITGIIAIVEHSKKAGFKEIFIPYENSMEASFCGGIKIYPIKTLSQLIEHITDQINIQPIKHKKIVTQRIHRGIKFEKIIGMAGAKRGLQIAAAGGHNTLLFGAPGCGKTILCRAFKYLLPPPNTKEVLESTKIYSVCGLLNEQTPIISNRPFREVHHTATAAALIGGGQNPKPGEISLAHNGVLFFDEIAEFPKKILETLRQPLEDKKINISRKGQTITYPSNFIFLATMNPCPCGYLGSKDQNCKCTDSQIKNYQKKISGPLLDRFDICLHIQKSSMGDLFQESSNPQNLTDRIYNASLTQKSRFNHNNADMNINEIKLHCQLSPENTDFLNQAAEKLKLSNRGYLKVLKVARTIADLESSECINQLHLAEALQYKSTSLTV
ncbi:hypothetical protein COU74_05215 [Candidatus Peregrinibacteria bacterium CG10_big_fil_rev_8_21_14_0_10_36_19]|nr:MAG: hypothetical protein COU74_05215 [Candidatus Peregrinibacteria bacterium CG10_big_fil_rev_8_21_14_0_10_36_19]